MPRADERHAAVAEGASLIAGSGLFTTAELPADECIVRFAGAPRTVEALDRLNHSCEPNLAWAGERTLVTIDAVAAGHELTLDYATVLDDPDLVLFCHCGTYRCRQVIEGSDWQIPQLQRRYAGQWHPAVQSRIDGTAR